MEKQTPRHKVENKKASDKSKRDTRGRGHKNTQKDKAKGQAKMTIEEFEKLKKGTDITTLLIANKYAEEIYKYGEIETFGQVLLYGWLYALGIQDGKREERASQRVKPLTERQKRKLENAITISTARKIGQYVSALSVSERGFCASYGYIYALEKKEGEKQQAKRQNKQARSLKSDIDRSRGQRQKRQRKKANKKRPPHNEV